MSEQQRVVIYHDKQGVFLGQFLGLAFWSKIETGWQPSAPMFTKSEAEEFMREALTFMGSEDVEKELEEYQFLVVEKYSNPDAADMTECMMIGIEPWEIGPGDEQAQGMKMH